MTERANFILAKLVRVSLLSLLLLLFASHLAAQDPPIPVKIELGARSDVVAWDVEKLITQVEQAKKKIQEVEKEKRTEFDTKLLEAQEEYRLRLATLKARMDEVDDSKDTIKELTKTRQVAEESEASHRKALDNIEFSEAMTDAMVDALTIADSKSGQEEKDAVEALRLATENETERPKKFAKATKELETLNSARKKIEERLAVETIKPEDKQLEELALKANECAIRIAEIEAAYNQTFESLEKERRETAFALRNEKQAKHLLDTKKLKKANEAYQLVQEAKRKQDAADAAAKREAARRSNSQTEKAVLGIETFLAELKVIQSKEDEKLSSLTAKAQNLQNQIDALESSKESIEALLPADAELDAAKEDYLKTTIQQTDELLRRAQNDRESLLDTLADTFRYVSTNEFKNSALAKFVEAQGLEQGQPLDFGDQQNKELTKFKSVTRLWDKALAEVENFDFSKEAAPEVVTQMSHDKELLPKRTKRWKQASDDIATVVGNRKKTLESLLLQAKECRTKIEIPVERLQERQQSLNSLAFWLKEDPPFGGIRRELMGLEIERLQRRSGKFGSEFIRSFYDHAKGFAGIMGVLLLCAALLLFVYRKTRSKTMEGARNAHERFQDPLYRLLSMSAWLLAEIGHHLFAIAGLMLVWRSFLPSDPIAVTLMIIIGLSALRLGLLRVLLFAEVADPKSSKMLFIDARKLIKVVMIGLFILLTPIAFFAHANAMALSQATRFISGIWIFVCAFWMIFRRDILLVLLPSKDLGALSRGLTQLIHYFWPLLTAFIGVICYLMSLGYQTASQNLASHSILAGIVLLTALVAYQFIQAYIDSKTMAFINSQEKNERHPHAEGDMQERHHETIRRVFSLPLLLLSTTATILAMRWALGITSQQWEKWGEITIFDGTTLSDLGTASIILVIGYVLGRTIRDLIVIGGSAKVSEDRRGTRYAVGTLIFYIIMTVTIVLSLKALAVDLAKYGWLLGSAGVALGFGMTEILSNFVCGVILFIERPVQVGDIITVGDVEGDVRRISIRSTIVQTRDGVSIILPNRRLIETDVVNWSHSDPLTRLRLSVGAAYGSDVALVKKALLEVAEREGRILNRPNAEVTFTEFGESELSFQLLCWLPTPDITAHRRVRSDMNSAIDAAFRRYGIQIPFPQRDLHLKSTPDSPGTTQEVEKPDDNQDGNDGPRTRSIPLP